MTTPSLTIRPATEADRDAVFSLFRDYGFEEAGLDSWVKHCLEQSKTKLFLGIVGGRPVAFGRVSVEADGIGKIHDLYTDAQYGGRGIGTAMMSFCENWLRLQKAGAVYLNVYKDNTGAQMLYAKQGYAFHFNQAVRGSGNVPVLPQPHDGHFFMIKNLLKI